ncbi:hypothetical protein [Pseudovibrio exalbescens]|uniref:hypothetical protein n=1 Tax=Pseudovibrio exalbescens TaxID=197461 RepID=UPI001F454CB4|nr:hypothetical protein [Pseudovibrio exalbescens]
MRRSIRSDTIERLFLVASNRSITTAKKAANKLAKADNVRLYLMVNPSGSAIGLYALNAHAVDALHRIASIVDAIGFAVAMLDFLDCGDPDRVARRKTLYKSYGFQPLVSNPLRMFLPVSVVELLINEETEGS